MAKSARSRSADETRRLGAALGKRLEPGQVLGLEGELGVGKTCFVQGLAVGLGVAPDIAITSPTFTLVGEYPGRVVLRHADFYRVESYERLEDAGFDDLLDDRGVLVVEWPERFPKALPAEHLRLRISLEGDTPDCERRLELVACGAKTSEGRERLERIVDAWP
jgi:tRNA threonylcarbamoyladenosine biosynthesis protein TsaE